MRRLLAFALALLAGAAAEARTILFVGNSFTFGDRSPVKRYRPDLVTDLNGEGIGGVPAIVATFAHEAGLDWQVSLETSPGKPLWWHQENRRALLDRRWDVVVLQGYSTLDPDHPGDPARHIAAAARLARMFKARNPQVEVFLTATWSRADLTYRTPSPWLGKRIEAMSDDLAEASNRAVRQVPELRAVLPVGQAWQRAMLNGVADPNPYDGIAFGQIDLWSWDQYHASSYGYYLEALIAFGRITGDLPRATGGSEAAAVALGLDPKSEDGLHRAAAQTLHPGP